MLKITELLVYPLVLILLRYQFISFLNGMHQCYELPTASGFVTTLWLTIPVLVSLLTILRQFPLSRFLNNVNIKILIQRNIISVVQKKALPTVLLFFVMFFVFSCVLTLTPAELLGSKSTKYWYLVLSC